MPLVRGRRKVSSGSTKVVMPDANLPGESPGCATRSTGKVITRTRKGLRVTQLDAVEVLTVKER